MKSMTKFLIAILFFPLLLASGCCKDCDDPNPPVPTPTHPTNLDIVWQRSYYSDSLPEIYLDPIFWNDYVICCSEAASNDNKEQGIRVFHKTTGEDHPAWNHDPGGIVDLHDYFSCIQLGGANQSTLFAGSSKYLYAIDLNSGQKIWKLTHDPYISIHKFSMLGDAPLQIYKPWTGGLSTTWCRVAKYEPLTCNKTDLIEIWMEDDYKFIIMPSTWTMNAHHDTLLLFLTSGWNQSLINGQVNAYCYNVTQKQMVWKKQNFTLDDDASAHPPVILPNNKVVFQGLRSFHCFDIETGELIWQHEYLPAIEGFSPTPLLYADEKLLIRSQTGNILCFDAQSGQELWINTNAKAYPAPDGRMDVYDGKLYLTGYPAGGEFPLMCFSVETGELLWKDEGPFGRVISGVIIDQNTGYLYCFSDWTMMCVDLNNTPLKKK